ncbi:hypothetical protein CGRA01v4_13845 [Colletotrichum graminicola]|uniref:Uncharacterized protein n=1 Tax=Colletotrichum graminicola (strain M1.001 / M2 / FGSC 10212) TaxID=645133 RepID=E3QU52_COLGM|nr:uncharacterized protein GLRG_09534 [Colletotrichum graminicola M1.001]EFQ34390.1 hypothetical protein GLRG_09534 [Colletotrichum graminicola M1.001]WDK22555.1 hypothetical protein CGRA01v4_13845 [Colletotrichum graminicola]
MAIIDNAVFGGLLYGGCGYAFLGLVTYTVVNMGGLLALPAWYTGSARGPKERVLLALWFPAIVALWPLVLPPWLAARFGRRACEWLRVMGRRARSRGRRLCCGGGDGSVDLESGGEISLDEGRRWARLGFFVNPFEDRGRSRSRARDGRPEVSENRSPMDRGADGSAAGSEQQQKQQQRPLPLPPTTWYTKLPSPEEMQRARAQASSGGSSAPPASLPQVADNVVYPDPAGRSEVLRRLQTIHEDKGGELGGGWEDVRLR